MNTKLADHIADTLEELIFTGSFKDGDRLDESTLAARFDVSRTPIREALQRLVTSHLADQRPRRGVFVRQPGSGKLIEMFETMAEIEAACGRLATHRATSVALAELETINNRCLQAINTMDADVYFRENESFHHMIYHQSGNAYLAKEACRLYRRLKPFRRLQLRLRGRMAQSVSEHQTILQALKSGDAEAAANALRGHVGAQGEKFYHQIIELRTAAE